MTPFLCLVNGMLAGPVDLIGEKTGLQKVQWIGLRENLQESPIFHGKIYGFL